MGRRGREKRGTGETERRDRGGIKEGGGRIGEKER